MTIEFSGDHAPHSGELKHGGKLPSWQRPPYDQDVIHSDDPEHSDRIEWQPQQTRGWTVQSTLWDTAYESVDHSEGEDDPDS